MGYNMAYPEYPIPAVAAVIRKKDRLLLVKRKNEPSRGQWSLPGGRIEVGERIEEALKREIKEELKVKIEVQELLAIKEYIERDKGGRFKWHYILLDYNCRIVSGVPQPSSDVKKMCWVGSNEFSDLELTQTTQELFETKHMF